ncbi:UNVERIFIED_CONTAM: hypothetical protein FKN15_037217 [Acipenser sinensis]
MSAVLGRAGAAGPSSLSRFRGALVGALLGDCVGAEFEGTEEVPLDRVLHPKANQKPKSTAWLCEDSPLRVQRTRAVLKQRDPGAAVTAASSRGRIESVKPLKPEGETQKEDRI